MLLSCETSNLCMKTHKHIIFVNIVGGESLWPPDEYSGSQFSFQLCFGLHLELREMFFSSAASLGTQVVPKLFINSFTLKTAAVASDCN